MDCAKIGRLIARLRHEKGFTQQELADSLGISNKTVSKWETGLGCPDLSLWNDLSVILGVDMSQLMEGEITPNLPDVGNISRVVFYVCPSCGNILTSTSGASISCCGRKLERLAPSNQPEFDADCRVIDDEYYLTFDHPMTKGHYLSFAAYVKSDKLFLFRMYPEQSPELRLPFIPGGVLYLHCVKDGLFKMPVIFK